jgi:hypothetical protein
MIPIAAGTGEQIVGGDVATVLQLQLNQGFYF